MASEPELMEAIKKMVSTPSVWTVGVTDNPNRRRVEHNSPAVWYHWGADTERIARNVEEYFVARGMKGNTGGDGGADYVYIFL